MTTTAVSAVSTPAPNLGTVFLKAQFGSNLQRLRRAEGISQERLAARASLHRNVPGKLERAEVLPALDTILKLAAALRLQPASLLEGMAWGGSEFGPSEDAVEECIGD